MIDAPEPEWIIESRRLAILAREYYMADRRSDAGKSYSAAATLALDSLPDDLTAWSVKRLAAVSRWLRQSIRFDTEQRLDHQSLSEKAQQIARHLVTVEDTAENRLHLAYTLGLFWEAHKPALSLDEEEAVLREAVDIYVSLIALTPEDDKLLRSADVAFGRLIEFLRFQGRTSEAYKFGVAELEIRKLESKFAKRASETLRAEVLSEQKLALLSREWNPKLACSHELASIQLSRELLSRNFKTAETGLFLAGSLRDIALFNLNEGMLDKAVTASEEMMNVVDQYVHDNDKASAFFDLALILGTRASVLDALGEETAARGLRSEAVELNRKAVELGPSDDYSASLVDSLVVLGGLFFYDEPVRAHEIIREALELAMRIASGDPDGSSDLWWKAVSGALAAYGAYQGEYGNEYDKRDALELMLEAKHRRSVALLDVGRSSVGKGDPERTDAFEAVLHNLM